MHERPTKMEPFPEAPYPRRRQTPQVSRIWLLGLLVLAAATTAACLAVQYQLAGVRDRVRQYAAERTAGRLGFDTVQIAGIRGIRIDGVTLRHVTENGVALAVQAPNLYVDLDLVDLLRGRVTVDRIALDNASVRIVRDPARPWFGKGEGAQGGPGLADLIAPHGFRITGSDCRVEIVNLVGENALALGPVEFDLMKVAGTMETVLDWRAALESRPNARSSGRILFAGADDFDGRLELAEVSAGDVNAFLPAERHFVAAGDATASIRLDASPGRPVALWANASFESLSLRNQPEFLQAGTGTLTAAAQFDPAERRLTVTSAKVRTEDIEGELEGAVLFDQTPPALDLRLTTTQLPLAPILDALLEGRLDEYGAVTVALHEPSAIVVALTGTPRDPYFAVEAQLAGADVAYVPKDKRFPEGEIALGMVQASWNSADKTPAVRGRVVSGDLRHADTGIEVARLAGDLALNGRTVTGKTVSGEITGQPFVGSVEFDLDAKRGTFELSGGLNQMENTILAERIKDTRLAGSAMVTCSGTLAPNKYTATARIEAGSARIANNWFFDKPIGIGAAGQVDAVFIPRKTIDLAVAATVASSELNADVHFERLDGKWRLVRTEASSAGVDVAAAARCLRLPYQIAGGTVTGGTYTWTRGAEPGVDSRIEAGGTIDALTLLPAGGQTPFLLRNATVSVAMSRGAANTGALRLHVADAATPPLGGATWFVDPRKDDPLLERFPRIPRVWDIDLSADAIQVPPWKGAAFKGKAYFDRPQSGLQSYSAQIEGGGTLEGWYSHVGGENLSRTYAKWTGIPSHYLIDHLKLPPILNGTSTGEVEFSVDRDDPDTKQGKGSFTIADGQFSADYLVTLLEGRFKNSMEVLPPSLRFDELAADVQFERDLVRTPRLNLASDGMNIDGAGQFVVGGDMDYTLDVALSPDAASEIKPLREGLNLDGVRLAQQTVDLTFEVKGPLFSPTGQVSKLPSADVVIVGGALGLGSELIDLPRQILVDLLKIGGGLVGATK